MAEIQGDELLLELEPPAESATRRLEWREPGARRPSNASLTKLYREFLPMTVPPGHTLVSYVLRHSSGSLKVNSSAGQSCRLGPGGLLLCGGPELQLLRGVVQHQGGCETIDLMVPSVRSPGVFAHLDDCKPVDAGTMRARRHALPPALRGGIAGTVESVAPGVAGLIEGDEIFGIAMPHIQFEPVPKSDGPLVCAPAAAEKRVAARRWLSLP